jgi:hypothetical protein
MPITKVTKHYHPYRVSRKTLFKLDGLLNRTSTRIYRRILEANAYLERLHNKIGQLFDWNV